jgi:proton-translocating NADH-quinone oxidoreductase chain M
MNTVLPLFLIPIIGFIIIAFIKDANTNKKVGLFVSLLTFMESLRLWYLFDYSSNDFQFQYHFDWISLANIDFNILFALDGISLIFIILTTLLIPICILTSWESIQTNIKIFILSFIALEILLIGVFTVLDLFGFYILFEAVLIPMFLIIGIFGSRSQRIDAAYYFFFYTLIGSVLMLIAILYIYSISGTTDYLSLLEFKLDPSLQNFLFLAFFASLAVKIPKFPFHIWLPQAHVEAPVAGSVILAGILIKLGGYGFIRFTIPLLPDASHFFTPLVFTLSILAVLYASLTTIRQTDLKRIIAYSSVSHMGIVSLAIFTFTAIGIEGSIFLQLAHGIVSSALFILVTVLYDRYHSRLVKYFSGVVITMPLFVSIFFFFTLANIAVPLSCNFIGEFLCLLATFQVNSFVALLATFGIVLSAAYSLFLFNRISFGSFSPHLSYQPDLSLREFFVLFPLLVLTLLFGLFPNLALDLIHSSVIHLLTYL